MEKQALRVANDTEYAVQCGIYRDIERRSVCTESTGWHDPRKRRHLRRISYGPFGGRRIASRGRFGGEWIIGEFTKIIGSPFARKGSLIFFKLMAGPKEQNAAPQNELGKPKTNKRKENYMVNKSIDLKRIRPRRYGSSRGLGRNTSLNLATRGVDIIFTYHSNKPGRLADKRSRRNRTEGSGISPRHRRIA